MSKSHRIPRFRIRIHNTELTKNLRILNLKYCYPVLGNMIQDVYSGSRIRIFFHPGGFRCHTHWIPGSRIRILNTELTKKLGIFNPKYCYQALGNMIQDFYLGSGFFWIPDPGVKKALGPGSGAQHCSHLWLFVISLDSDPLIWHKSVSSVELIRPDSNHERKY